MRGGGWGLRGVGVPGARGGQRGFSVLGGQAGTPRGMGVCEVLGCLEHQGGVRGDAPFWGDRQPPPPARGPGFWEVLGSLEHRGASEGMLCPGGGQAGTPRGAWPCVEPDCSGLSPGTPWSSWGAAVAHAVTASAAPPLCPGTPAGGVLLDGCAPGSGSWPVDVTYPVCSRCTPAPGVIPCCRHMWDRAGHRGLVSDFAC